MFGVLALPTWHATHRLHMTAHDLGLIGGIIVKMVCYGTAWVLILTALAVLLAV